jgi:hypothetical protein
MSYFLLKTLAKTLFLAFLIALKRRIGQFEVLTSLSTLSIYMVGIIRKMDMPTPDPPGSDNNNYRRVSQPMPSIKPENLSHQKLFSLN